VPAGRESFEYANFTLVDSKKDEMRITFAVDDGTPALGTQPVGTAVRRLVMLPTNVKALHDLLGQVIDQYESKFGPIEYGFKRAPDFTD